MTKAVGYVRRSTDRQEESLAQQRSQLAQFAKSRDWQLAEIFEDDAISGSEMKRPGLDQLLHAAGQPDVEIVLVWDRNRLARPKDAIDGMLLERQLHSNGTRVIYAATGQEPDGSFQSGLMSFVEHHQNGDYLRKLSRDTMRGTVDRAKRGLWAGGPIPFGFDRLLMDGDKPKRIVRQDDEGGQVVLDAVTGSVLDKLPRGRSHKKQKHESSSLSPSTDARVRAVQKLFADFAAGVPTRRLRDELNASGMRTSRGQIFTPQTIGPMLENPAYVGRCVYNRRTLSKWHCFAEGASVERHDEGVEKRSPEDWIVRENAWPALVDVATFEAVQARRKMSREGKLPHYRGNAMKSEYLLSGLMRCGVCGGKMTGNTQKSGKGYKTRYYTCTRHHAGYRDECPKRYLVPAPLVEDHILATIREDLTCLRDDEELHRQVGEQLDQLRSGTSDAREQLGKRLSSIDDKISRVREHVLAVDPSVAESLGFYDQAKQLSDEREQVQADLTAAGPEPALPAIPELRQRINAEFDHMEALIASGTLEERRALVGCYVAQIKTKPEEATVCIGFLSGLSQVVAGTGFEPVTFGL
jgi:site-specific DNA recombinase